ncbi:P-loop containing nucleoside triphosphate hydrolase protein [Armillaria gallica]|uniref:P-loop containing nucleoside triphosphate hydrolase protein n=1 Tax=Armillaria gallica TaxID=47427 RepID=A0A2H3DND9_ARMGA|nr:P-loop containing nucleoside triphosphate hydrolase protein [Armillaria gallica]
MAPRTESPPLGAFSGFAALETTQQVVLQTIDDAISKKLVFDTLTIPLYAAVASAAFLLAQVLRAFLQTKSVYADDEEHRVVETGYFENHVAQRGGTKIFVLRVLRLLGCLALLGLSIPTISVNATIPLTLLYTSLLAIVSVTASNRWSRIGIHHMNVVLLSTSAIYVYRDIAPLATFDDIPQDSWEGPFLWIKMGILLFIAILIPLIIPREYTPVDPKNPMSVPNPEQTTPILSFVLYSWLDSLIIAAYRAAHLSYEQLPPLADYDRCRYLKTKAFRYLDTFLGAKKQHMSFGLMRVFAWEFMIMALMITIEASAHFVAPIGINRLLRYIEKGEEGTQYRPWVWIVWIFLGPTFVSLASERYLFINTRVRAHAEVIVTQLVFEHALRIRMKFQSHDIGFTEATPEVSSQPGIGAVHTAESSTGEEITPRSIAKSKGDAPKPPTDMSTASTTLPSPDTQSEVKNFVGRINNLVTSDIANIAECSHVLRLFYSPLELVFCIWFLYVILGWSSFAGLAVIVIMAPLPGYLAKRIQTVQKATLKNTDGRVQVVTEFVNILRMIKMFGWEGEISKRVAGRRDEELVWIKKKQLLGLVANLLNAAIPALTMLVTYATYVRTSSTIVMGETLDASKVFSSMTIFDMFAGQLTRTLRFLNICAVGKVSLDRLTDFMQNTELLDTFSEKDFIEPVNVEDQEDIGFHQARFSWMNEIPSHRTFLLRVDEEVIFRKNSINLVIGPTGSGKTSLLMALLGEMHFLPSNPASWFNLPRKGGVAYAAQESWKNILFDAEFDEMRYKDVVHQCGLERDLALFEAGDETEVGEKGLTLSGGQKARVTLARAVYSRADILILDDVLAALDVHTSKWIVQKCLQGNLISNRTVILATHNIALVEPIAEFVVALKNGRVVSQGTLKILLSRDRTLAEEARQEEEALHRADEEVVEALDAGLEKKKKPDGKLILSEEIRQGHISWSSFKLYLTSLGGHHIFLFFAAFLGAFSVQQFVGIMQTWYLGYWASQYDDHKSEDVPIFFYLGAYSSLLLLGFALHAISYVVYVFGTIRASRSIHKRLMVSILGTTLRWLDITPASRIIARCTLDIRAVDSTLPTSLFHLTSMSMAMLLKFSAIVVFTPAFLVPGLIMAIAGAYLGQIYMKAQLPVKREMSNAKAPVLGHFGAAIAGLTSIRAYGAESASIQESPNRIDRYTRTTRAYYNLNRWVDVRADALGALFSASLAAYLVYAQNARAFNVGFSLNMAVGFTSKILFWVRFLNRFEIEGNRYIISLQVDPLHLPFHISLERIQSYLDVDHEEKPSKVREPPASWPTSGQLRVENLSARYSPDGPKVLHDLSFTIQSGERIGIVGRTGSGKSSLTLSLLRCIHTEGKVYYDGIPTTAINLDALRSRITIIPQVPELLSGTLRQNLDPFDRCDDATLNDALRAAGLFSLQGETNEGRITLDSVIATGGGNLSVGQRQILALARALVRGSKLFILDEATSAIDYKTDSIIQSSLRNELGTDATLITVAHRLQTVMDADRIMVLDAGHIVEFDTPQTLLKDPHGKLRSLVDKSADRDLLYAMAEQKHK